jgi:putative ATP-dependent endonuclease of the OLD family
MARIRKIEIANFRGIRSLTWQPAPGMNCLIGPGDHGKSTVLDGIALCLGARRNVQFSDADFYNLDVKQPISISVTIGHLDDALKNFDTYGLFLRGFRTTTGEVADEPEKDLETVLNKLTGEKADASAALVQAARHAREAQDPTEPPRKRRVPSSARSYCTSGTDANSPQ